MNILSTNDWIALIWFIVCWGGYTYFSFKHRQKAINLAVSLSNLRVRWINAMVNRDMRITDATVLGVLQRTVTFFASTTIFILAGLLAVLGASDKAMRLAQALPFVAEHSQANWEMKILVLIFIFIYAFFKFSWSVRQYNFSLVMFGAAPNIGDPYTEQYIRFSNELLTSANNSFSYGLRAFSFSMACITWFVDPFLFMFSTIWVVAILYRREFHSRTLAAMQGAFDNQKRVNDADATS